MTIKDGLSYTRGHQWIADDNGLTVIGITDYAQTQLGGVMFVNLPEEGDSLKAGEPLGDVESIKVVSEVQSPVSGVVVCVNEELMDEPQKVNEDPYGAWLVKASGITETVELLTAEEYGLFIAQTDQ